MPGCEMYTRNAKFVERVVHGPVARRRFKGLLCFLSNFFFLPHSDRASFALSLELRVQLVPYIPPLPDCRTLEIMDGGGSSVFAQ